jgi:hypothetical protein
MRHPTLLALGLTAATVLAVGATAGAANADPVNAGLPVQITCAGDTFDAVTEGHGHWTPAHNLTNTSVLIPVAFGETKVYENGVLVRTDPPIAKRAATTNRHATTTCTYTASSTEGGITLTIVGSATAIITPAH